MSPLVSIVIPVYNVEDCLKRCVDSVIEQTYDNLEIILVNDGSTDNSGEICKSLSAEDERIKVFHQSNKGLSATRNFGVMQSTGKYILFLDSDDFIELNSVEILVEKMEYYDLDVIEGNAIVDRNGEIEKLITTQLTPEKIYSGIDYMVERIDEDNLTAASWLKFCNRKFLLEHNLLFKDKRLHEDELWTPQVFLKAKKVMYLDFPFYHYIIRENSITTSTNKTKNVLDFMANCYELEEIYKKSDLKKEQESSLRDYLARQYMAISRISKNNLKFYATHRNHHFIRRNIKKTKTFTKYLIYALNLPFYVKLSSH